MMPAKKRSEAELDELAVDAASLMYEEGLTAKAILQRFVAAGRPVRSERDIRFLLARARDKDRKLVSIRVQRMAATPHLDPALGRELALATRIHRAIVVDAPRSPDRENLQAPAGPVALERALRESNKLHALLGAAAADHLLLTLRETDRIAVGGGRGVAETIQALESSNNAQRLRRNPVSSLSGGITRPNSTHGLGRGPLDADDNASRLAAFLKTPDEDLTLTDLPGYVSVHRDELVDADAPHLKSLDADVLIYGAGVVDHMHYLMRRTNRVIAREIDALKQIVGQHRASVIDFTENFYASPSVPPEIRARVERIVTALRAKAVTVSPDQLGGSGERILVAGGRAKLEALALLVEESWQGPRPTTLVTDADTASGLLAIRRSA